MIMVTLKCKMCGGDLELTPDVTVAECPYCGTKQTVPNADNEKKMTLFSRANRLRFNNEFDKAAGVYETIIGEFPEEAEAYWGLVLCKYGIEYVDDPATAKKIPTCHRSSFDSVMEDENLELAMEYADAVAKRMYREEAKQIEEIRKGILEVSSKEEPYDVFICYKETDESGERTLDSVLAQDIYNELTEKGYRVFFSRITLEDKLGQEYEPYIFAALHSARVMLAVGTSYEHYDAVWVKNEWSRYLQLMAAGEKKTLIPCYKDLDAYDMPKEFAKLQAQDLGKVGAMQDLMRGVEKILGKNGEQSAYTSDTAVDSGMAALNTQTEALIKRGNIALENGKFDQAKDFFDQALNYNAECGQAYFGKVLAGRKVRNKEELINSLIENEEYYVFVLAGCIPEREVLKPDIPLATIAREADSQIGILSEFTDRELESVLTVEFDIRPMYYKKYARAWQDRLDCYSDLEAITNTIFQFNYEPYRDDNIKADYKCAVKYADNAVRKELEALRTEVADWIKGKMEEEKRIPIKWREEQKKKSAEIKEAMSDLINKAPEIIANQEAEQKKRAEADYQAAVHAVEEDYKKRLDAWKKEKAAYLTQYDIATAKQSEMQGKIAQLEQEKAQLKGFFIGKKRKELEENIAILRNSLMKIELPQDPGEQPICGELPNRKDFYKGVNIEQEQEKSCIKAAVFPNYRKRLSMFKDQIKKLAGASVGEKVYFGKYPYDEDGNAQEIQWRVLDKKENSVLLLTEYGIDARSYHEEEEDITWENCTMRRWLNEEFLNEAFCDSEKKLIQTTYVDNSLEEGWSYMNGGNNTEDRVFLLSYKEAFEDYFSDDNSRICFSTEYAESQIRRGGSTSWWLRSPGEDQNYAVVVEKDGSCGSWFSDSDFFICVRPALWINLESDIF